MGETSSYSPQLWPIVNLFRIWKLTSSKITDNTRTTRKQLSLGHGADQWHHDMINRYLLLTTYLFIGYIAYIFTFPQNANKLTYNQLTFYWLPIIIIRDLTVTLIFYGGWDWLLYSYTPVKNKMSHLKYNFAMPDDEQWYHDCKYTIIGTIILSFCECICLIFIIYYDKQGLIFNCQNNGKFEYTISNLFVWCFLIVVILYFNEIHFYFTHRMIHPWFATIDKKSIYYKYDFGRFLYKNIHSLHHTSYNPFPWSGLSMHPIEHIIYFSSLFFVLYLIIGLNIESIHPIHLLFSKYHLGVNPSSSHDGYDSPGGGSLFHYIHHAHFQCNFGTPMIPFDKWYDHV